MIEPLAIVPRNRRRIALAVLTALSFPVMPIYPVVAAGAVQAAERMSYVLFAPGGGSTMSGSMEDVRRARSLRAGREGLLYVRHGGAAYVIRDAATLRQAESILEPQRALGAQQGELGSRQAALGHRQGRLGAEQARLGLRQADTPPRRAGELSRQQAELGRQQAALGAQQAVLGERQAALGREQARLARLADERVRVLIADAVRRGVAQPAR